MSNLTPDDIRQFQSAVYTFGMIVRANVETIAMQSTNQERLMKGKALAYGEEEFMKVLDDCGVNHNSLVTNIFQR